MAARKLRDAYGKNKRKYWAARNKKYLAGRSKRQKQKINAGQLFFISGLLFAAIIFGQRKRQTAKITAENN